MCNCGKRRTDYSQQTHSANSNTKLSNRSLSPAFSSFEYTGKTALSVTGKITRTQYRFNTPGSRQNIDARDAPGLMSVPVLRKLT